VEGRLANPASAAAALPVPPASRVFRITISRRLVSLVGLGIIKHSSWLEHAISFSAFPLPVALVLIPVQRDNSAGSPCVTQGFEHD
jgi:hypothetical protein